MTSPQPSSMSPYKRGAVHGFGFGLFMSVIFIAWVLMPEFPWLSFLIFPLMLYVPVYTYRTMRSTQRAEYATTPLSSLWMQGIMMTGCGALICSLVMVIWFKWIDPDFMARQLQTFIDIYNQTKEPALAESAKVAQLLIDKQAIPSASTFAQAFWLMSVSFGSILSLLIATLARIFPPRKL